jgi:hypothetical protein
MTLSRFWGVNRIVFGRVKLLKLFFYTPKKIRNFNVSVAFDL